MNSVIDIQTDYTHILCFLNPPYPKKMSIYTESNLEITSKPLKPERSPIPWKKKSVLPILVMIDVSTETCTLIFSGIVEQVK